MFVCFPSNLTKSDKRILQLEQHEHEQVGQHGQELGHVRMLEHGEQLGQHGQQLELHEQWLVLHEQRGLVGERCL